MVFTAGSRSSSSSTCSSPMILSQLGTEMAAQVVGDSSTKRKAVGGGAEALPIHQATPTERQGTPWMVPDTVLAPASTATLPPPQPASRRSAQVALMAP